MFFRREIVLCRTSIIRWLCCKRFTLVKGLIFVVALSLASSIFFSYHLMFFNFGLVKRQADPPQPIISCRVDSIMPKIQQRLPKDHSSEAGLRIGRKVLIMVETQFSKSGTKITHLLEALRIDFKVETTGKNIPTLTHADKGKFAVIIFENFDAYVRMDNWNRQLLDKYCREYNVGMIVFVPSKEDMDEEVVPGFPLKLQYNLELENYKLTAFSDIWRLTKPGETFKGKLPGSDWTLFHTNHSTYEPLSFSQPATPDGQSTVSSTNKKRVVTVLYDSGQYDGIRRVLYGSCLNFWIHQLIFIDSLSFFSHGKLSITLHRYIQVDVDDIFVGKEGIRMKVVDVEVSFTFYLYCYII